MEDSGEMLEEPAGITLILLTWRMWWAPNNASKWHMGFHSAFKGLICIYKLFLPSVKTCVGSKYGKVVDSDNYCGCQQVNWCRLRYSCLRFPSVQLVPCIMCEVTGSTVVFLWCCITTNGSSTRVELFSDGILLFVIEGYVHTSFYVRVERREGKNVTYKRERVSYL